MRYEEYIEKIKKMMKRANVKGFSKEDHLAYQVNIIGEGEGAFYIELKEGAVEVQPYEYYDRDVIFNVSEETLLRILDGSTTVAKELEMGDLIMYGNYDVALQFDQLKPVSSNKTQETKRKSSKETKKVKAKEEDDQNMITKQDLDSKKEEKKVVRKRSSKKSQVAEVKEEGEKAE